MPAVLVAGHITKQNLPFLQQRWLKPPVLTHRGMARLSRPGMPGKFWDSIPAEGGQQSQY